MNAFRDHFSDLAALYARARPDYPAALYAWLSEKAPGRALAVDVGCGSGQATHGLAPHFDQVIGTDASGEQIDRAQPAGPVRFEVAPAEACPVDDGTVDLLTAAQAAHWFDHDAFQPEAHRVLRPGGLLAFWTYELLRIEPAIDAIIDRYCFGTVGPDWPPERRHVNAGYRTLPFPFEEIEPPDLTIEKPWSADELLAYLGSWSSTRRHAERTGTDPVPELEQALRPLYGEGTRLARWRLRVRGGYRP